MSGEYRAPQFTRYQPKRWHPEFTLIVLGSISGKSNIELGVEFGYSAVHISNILCTAQAEEIRCKIRETLNKEAEKSFGERVNNLGELAFQKIESFVKDEDRFQTRDPFRFVDRMMKVATMTSKLGPAEGNNLSRGSTNIQVNGSASFVLNADQANGIRNALSESLSIDSISENSVPDRELEDPTNKLKLLKNG